MSKVQKEIRDNQVDIWGTSIPDRENSKCKGPKAEEHLVNSKKEANVAGVVREVKGSQNK